jgi:hypothetical protein
MSIRRVPLALPVWNHANDVNFGEEPACKRAVTRLPLNRAPSTRHATRHNRG